MVVSTSGFYLIFFMICISYQYHGSLASAVSPSNYTASDHLATSPHGRAATNTTVTMDASVTAIDFFDRAPPFVFPPSRSAKGWPSADDFKLMEPVLCRGNITNCTNKVSPRNRKHISPTTAHVSSNGSTNGRVPLHHRLERRPRERCRSSGGAIEIRKLLSSYHRPSRLPSDYVGTKIAAIVVSTVLLVLLCILAGFLVWCTCSNTVISVAIELEADRPILQPELLRQVTGPRRYSYSKLVAATNNFAESKKVGRGGFGSVYCGYLDELDRHVAIKMLSMESMEQGRKEFEAEVKVMSQLRHRNVVQLIGWCDSRRGLWLVYELVPGGSLDKHLYDPERMLTWQERYKIVLGLGAAIQYLHKECNQCVVHGDIKPSNVMLDSSRNAKLGDFGLARLVSHGAEAHTTQVLAGTIGYVDPGFIANQKRVAETDVYSFGVVLLEIACGRRPVLVLRAGQRKKDSVLVKRVIDMYSHGVILDAADGRLDGEFDERQMERVLVTGLWCSHHDQSQRPSIAQAMSVLRCDAEMPVLPAMHWSGETLSLEQRAYGELSTESSVSTTHLSTGSGSVYDTPEHSTCTHGLTEAVDDGLRV